LPVCGHEVRARVMGRRRPMRWKGGPFGALADATAGGGAARSSSWGGRESMRKAHVLHRGAGTSSVPPRRYTGRPSGKHHVLGQRAHRAVHHGYPGPGHSGAMNSIRQPSRDALVTSTSRRLNGGFAHRVPALGWSHDWANASSALVQKGVKRWSVGVAKASLTGAMPRREHASCTRSGRTA